MARDFISQLDKSYNIPSQVFISDTDKPIDMRQICDTVLDFETFFETTGMELRYDGLITYEKQNKLFKGCRVNQGGAFEWVILNIGTSETEAQLSEVRQEMATLKEELSRIDIMFEEARSIMFID